MVVQPTKQTFWNNGRGIYSRKVRYDFRSSIRNIKHRKREKFLRCLEYFGGIQSKKKWDNRVKKDTSNIYIKYKASEQL